jgi:hypothetical protein
MTGKELCGPDSEAAPAASRLASEKIVIPEIAAAGLYTRRV